MVCKSGGAGLPHAKIWGGPSTPCPPYFSAPVSESSGLVVFVLLTIVKEVMCTLQISAAILLLEYLMLDYSASFAVFIPCIEAYTIDLSYRK